MPPSNDFWAHLDTLQHERQQSGLARQRRVWHPISPRLMADDVGREFVNFGSNDYLSMSWHPEVAQAMRDGSTTGIDSKFETNAYRCGSGASPLVTGYSNDHQALARSIADFEQTEDALLFASGFAANVGTVSALASQGDVVFSDQLNHASLIDGCRLSRAKVIVFPHNDMQALEELVQRHRSDGHRAFVVTDSLFSMDGDVARLAEILQLCEAMNMMGIVDEAHATGVYGNRGTGLIEALGLESDRWIRTGTLSKAIGCMGGFVAGPRRLTDWLCNAARTYVYSTAAPAPLLRAAKKSISLISRMNNERTQLRERSRELRNRLRNLGFRVGGDESPIVAIYVTGSSDRPNEGASTNHASRVVMEWSSQLQEHGLFVPGIRPPTVPESGCLLRVSLNTSHTEGDLDRLVRTLANVVRS
jgi:8-amino-7-oxononanoate synthase